MGPSLLWASACLLSCKAGPRTFVYVTGGRGSKHVPVRGQAGPGLALSKLTEGREHRPPANVWGRGVSVVRTHRPGATSTGASRVSRQMSSAPQASGATWKRPRASVSLASPPSALRTSSPSDSTRRPQAPSPTLTCFQPGVLGRPSPCPGSTSWTKLHSASRP